MQVIALDASWDIVQWKVKNLKSKYNKAETWRKSTGAKYVCSSLIEIFSFSDKLRKMYRFYDEWHNIFGHRTPEFPFEIYDSRVTINNGLKSTPVTERTLGDQRDFCGFESLDGYCSIPVLQYTGSVDIEAESADMLPSSSLTETNGNTGLQNNNKAVLELDQN